MQCPSCDPVNTSSAHWIKWKMGVLDHTNKMLTSQISANFSDPVQSIQFNRSSSRELQRFQRKNLTARRIRAVGTRPLQKWVVWKKLLHAYCGYILSKIYNAYFDRYAHYLCIQRSILLQACKYPITKPQCVRNYFLGMKIFPQSNQILLPNCTGSVGKPRKMHWIGRKWSCTCIRNTR